MSAVSLLVWRSDRAAVRTVVEQSQAAESLLWVESGRGGGSLSAVQSCADGAQFTETRGKQSLTEFVADKRIPILDDRLACFTGGNFQLSLPIHRHRSTDLLSARVVSVNC